MRIAFPPNGARLVATPRGKELDCQKQSSLEIRRTTPLQPRCWVVLLQRFMEDFWQTAKLRSTHYPLLRRHMVVLDRKVKSGSHGPGLPFGLHDDWHHDRPTQRALQIRLPHTCGQACHARVEESRLSCFPATITDISNQLWRRVDPRQR